VLVSLVSFNFIDLLLIEHLVEPILNNRRRGILDRLADEFGGFMGVSALAAAKGRAELRKQPKSSETEQ